MLPIKHLMDTHKRDVATMRTVDTCELMKKFRQRVKFYLRWHKTLSVRRDDEILLRPCFFSTLFLQNPTVFFITQWKKN